MNFLLLLLLLTAPDSWLNQNRVEHAILGSILTTTSFYSQQYWRTDSEINRSLTYAVGEAVTICVIHEVFDYYRNRQGWSDISTKDAWLDITADCVGIGLSVLVIKLLWRN